MNPGIIKKIWKKNTHTEIPSHNTLYMVSNYAFPLLLITVLMEYKAFMPFMPQYSQTQMSLCCCCRYVPYCFPIGVPPLSNTPAPSFYVVRSVFWSTLAQVTVSCFHCTLNTFADTSNMSTGDASDYNFLLWFATTVEPVIFRRLSKGFVLPNKGNHLHTMTIPYLTDLCRL